MTAPLQSQLLASVNQQLRTDLARSEANAGFMMMMLRESNAAASRPA